MIEAPRLDPPLHLLSLNPNSLILVSLVSGSSHIPAWFVALPTLKLLTTLSLWSWSLNQCVFRAWVCGREGKGNEFLGDHHENPPCNMTSQAGNSCAAPLRVAVNDKFISFPFHLIYAITTSIPHKAFFVQKGANCIQILLVKCRKPANNLDFQTGKYNC